MRSGVVPMIAGSASQNEHGTLMRPIAEGLSPADRARVYGGWFVPVVRLGPPPALPGTHLPASPDQSAMTALLGRESTSPASRAIPLPWPSLAYMTDFQVWQVRDLGSRPDEHGAVWRWRIDRDTHGEAATREDAEEEARTVLRVMNAPSIVVPSVPDLSDVSSGAIRVALFRRRRGRK